MYSYFDPSHPTPIPLHRTFQVPNIRIRAAQALGVASKHMGEELGRAYVRPVLTVLLTDKDRDVQYYATESMKFCA